LRHTFASKLAVAGINDRALQKLGRWTHAGIIERYAHLSDQHLAESLERIGQKPVLIRDLILSRRHPPNTHEAKAVLPFSRQI
jgi:hypothetical protein